ncbi:MULTISPECIES: glycosyltransferase [unclassified Sphingobacterium]|uniref:glycosyltransferase n=1 Tax=unclassified Sphingobacterium TaxID=2609468 RepID=UPI0025DEAE35|nr:MULTISPECIES: glycosyltransferase [unclassified Sphingobacterium]
MSRLEMGGIEKTLLSCIPYLNEAGVEMSILCSIGGELDEQYRNLGVKLIDFGDFKKPFKDAKFLEKILEDNQFDIVHSRFGHTSGLFAKVCKKMKIPFLVSIHNERAMFKNGWKTNPLLKTLRACYLYYHKKLTIKYATKIIGHSKANLKYFFEDLAAKSESGQVEVLYNGVDFSKFESFPELNSAKKQLLKDFISEAEKVIVHIGSFKEQKNHTFLLDIFKNLDPKANKYKLLLLGGGGLIDKIKHKVSSYGLENYVLFAGVESNIAPYLNVSDIFVFPSLYEGFGNVLIEAQYANLPILASKIAPHYEATSSVYHSYFFNPNDVEEGTKNLLKLIASDNSERIRVARNFSENFSIQEMAKNLLRIYNQTCYYGK